MRVLVAALVLTSAGARAATPLCLEVRADSDAAGLRRLVEDELRHHPTHKQVQEGCESRLTVELFSAAGARYLTTRVNQEVPVRYAVKSARDVEDKLSEALGQVLQHDPVYLAEDMSRMSAAMRAANNVIKRGINRYRFDLYEVMGWAVRNGVFASGAAFSVVRGIDHWQVFAKLELAGDPSPLGERVSLRVLAGGEIGVLWEASARANNSFYLGPGLGLHYLRYEGKLNDSDGSLLGPAWQVTFSASLRAGVHFLRFYGFDIDLFAQLNLPLHPTHDPDSTLVRGYAFFGSAGLGVGF